MDCSMSGTLFFTVSQSLLRFMFIEPVNDYLTISFSAAPFSFCLQAFPTSGSFPMSQPFASGGKVLELQLQYQSFQRILKVDFLWDSLVWSPCCPRDCQESSPAIRCEGISSTALSLLYGPSLISIHEWKKHSFDYMDLCWQSDVSAF